MNVAVLLVLVQAYHRHGNGRTTGTATDILWLQLRVNVRRTTITFYCIYRMYVCSGDMCHVAVVTCVM